MQSPVKNVRGIADIFIYLFCIFATLNSSKILGENIFIYLCTNSEGTIFNAPISREEKSFCRNG